MGLVFRRQNWHIRSSPRGPYVRITLSMLTGVLAYQKHAATERGIVKGLMENGV